MADSVSSIIVKIKSEGMESFVKSLDQAEKESDQLNENLDKTNDEIDKVGKGSDKLSAGFKKMGAAVAAAFATAQIAKFIQQSVKLADIQLKAEAQLLKGLKGRQDVQKRLITQAKQLQSVTTFGDEQIIGQQAYLASLEFTEEQINNIISASVDLSAGANISLESSVRNIAKTYSGLGGELSELIPQLRNLSTEQLKNGEGVKVITELYKGQAEVLRETGTGGIQALNNAIGDLQEEFGKALLEGLAPLASELQDIAENEAVLGFFRALGTVVGEALEVFAEITGSVGDFFGWIKAIGAADKEAAEAVAEYNAAEHERLRLFVERGQARIDELKSIENKTEKQRDEIKAISESLVYKQLELDALDQMKIKRDLLLDSLKITKTGISAETEAVEKATQAWRSFESQYISVAGTFNDVTLFEDLPDRLEQLSALALKVGFNMAAGLSDAVPVAEDAVGDVEEVVVKTSEQIQQERIAKQRDYTQAGQQLQQEGFNIAQGFLNAESQALENQYREGIIGQKEYQEERAKLQEKQAKADKAQAIFNILLGIPTAVTSALKYGPIFAGIVGALAAAQLAVAIKTPIPSFDVGTKGRKKTPAGLKQLHKDELVIDEGNYDVITATDSKEIMRILSSYGIATQYPDPVRNMANISYGSKYASKDKGINFNPLLDSAHTNTRKTVRKLDQIHSGIMMLNNSMTRKMSRN